MGVSPRLILNIFFILLIIKYRDLIDTVTLLVGVKNEKFTIHKSVLCAQSKFFEAACKNEWMDSNDRSLKLPEDESDCIRAMITWMYHPFIRIPKGLCGKEKEMARVAFLARLWVVADKFNILRLRNDSLDGIIHYLDNYVRGTVGKTAMDFFHHEVLSFVYQNTYESAPIRKVLVDFAIETLEQNDVDVLRGSPAEEFLFELLKNMMSNSRRQPKASLCVEFCSQYHEHDDRSSECTDLKKPTVPSSSQSN